MTETLANGYSSECSQRELSNEYKHAWQGLDNFQKYLCPNALDESSLSSIRVNFIWFIEGMILKSKISFLQIFCYFPFRTVNEMYFYLWLCLWLYFQIFSGTDDTGPQLAKLCHRQNKPQMISTNGNHMFLRFRSDSSRQGKGFHATYSTHLGGRHLEFPYCHFCRCRIN